MSIPTGGAGQQQSSPEVPLEGGAQYTHNLSNEADTNTVAPGPGGSSVVVDRMLVSDPAQAGVRGNERGSDSATMGRVSADSPLLEPANYQSSYDFGPFFTNLASIGAEEENILPPDIEEEPSELDQEIASLLAEEVSTGPTVELISTFDNLEVESSALFAAAGGGPPASDLSSTDESVVLHALTTFTAIATDPTLSPEQKTVVEQALKKLAGFIAKQNADQMSDPDLKSWNPAVVSQALKSISAQANIGLKGDALDLVNGALSNAGNRISSLNLAEGSVAPIDPTFTALNSSSDADDIYNELLKNVDLTTYSEDRRASLQTTLRTLADRIALANSSGRALPGIESPDRDTIVGALSSLLGFEEDPMISTAQKNILRMLVSALSDNIAKINENKWTEDAHSTDANVVYIALKKLSNSSYDKTLSNQERSIGEDYLKILSAALAYMSTLRATTARLEGELEKNISKAKLDNVHEQTKIAKKNYTTACEAIDVELRKIAESKKTAEIMKIVMPVITALMAVVSVIVTIVTLGAAAPAVCAAMCVMIVAMTATMIALESTKALDKMCDDLHQTDPVARAGIKTGIQLAMVAVMIILTAGVCAAAAPVLLGAQAAEMTASIAAQTALRQIATNPMIWTTVAGMTMSSFMSSGLLNLGLVAMYQKFGLEKDKSELAAMITAIIIMIVIMIALIIFGQGGKGAKGIADEAGTFVGAKPTGTQGASGLTIGGQRGTQVGVAGSGTQTVAAGVKTGVDALTKTLKATADNSAIMQMLQTLARKMTDLLKDPFFYTQLMSATAQITPQAMQIVSLQQKIELTLIQIELQKQLSQGEALLAYLKQFVPGFDINLEGLQDDAKKMNEFMLSLLTLFSQMVQAASQITTRLHQAG